MLILLPPQSGMPPLALFCMTLPNSSYFRDNSLLLIMSSNDKTCNFYDVPRHNAALIYATNLLLFVTAAAARTVSPTQLLGAVPLLHSSNSLTCK